MGRWIVVMVALLSACSVVRTPTHPTVQRSEASHEDTDASRLETVKRIAAKDLSCPQVEVVLSFNRDYANVAQPSRVVDGCGKRAVYAEACEEYPRCRYLLLSVLTVPDTSSTSVASPSP